MQGAVCFLDSALLSELCLITHDYMQAATRHQLIIRSAGHLVVGESHSSYSRIGGFTPLCTQESSIPRKEGYSVKAHPNICSTKTQELKEVFINFKTPQLLA